MFRMLRRSVFLLLSVAASAHAGDRHLIANEGSIGDRWAFAEGVSPRAPGYPAPFLDGGHDVCIALGYVIGEDGTTSDFVLLDRWSSDSGRDEPKPGFWEAFSQASAGAVSQWRFQPRPGVGPVATFTVATMAFRAGPGADLAGIRARCAVGDLQAHLDDASRMRKRLDVVRMDAAYRSRDVWINGQLTRTIPSAPINGAR